jgi:hypothetical protein
MNMRHLKRRYHAVHPVSQVLVRAMVAMEAQYRTEPPVRPTLLELFRNELFRNPEGTKVRLVRKKDGEFAGEYDSLELAEAAIAKAKASKKAALVIA